jgi:hypothetical protein
MVNGDKPRGQAFRLVRMIGIVATIGFAVTILPASAQNVPQLDLSVGYLNPRQTSSSPCPIRVSLRACRCFRELLWAE